MADKKMPSTKHINIALSEADQLLLEQVRQQQGLDSIEQTAEWLAKSALRKTARTASGRGRALYPVNRENP